jgi:hypothetical protein
MDNIKMDLGDRDWGNIYWFGVGQDRDKWKALVNAVMNLRGSIICWEVLGWLYNWWPLE